MKRITEEKIVVITRKTRLEELLYRFNTISQTKFYIEHLGGDFEDYEIEHKQYQYVVKEALKTLDTLGKTHKVDREFLPNYIFGKKDIVVVIGQDGLVANTIKYLDGQKLIGVNPDPNRWDGVLLPFQLQDLYLIAKDTLSNSCNIKNVTLAKATLNTGEAMYGVNDIFIGPKTHQSLRYNIKIGQRDENQSSSGIIISTGLGSTGWFTSLLVGANMVSKVNNKNIKLKKPTFPWDSEYLYFTVREPFPSKYSQTNIIFGKILREKELIISSYMPENGVIFSDGIENDFINFNSGSIVKVGIAEKKGCLVI